jgi:hypothetical protein
VKKINQAYGVSGRRPVLLELAILRLCAGFWLFWLSYNYFSGYFLHFKTYFVIVGSLVSLWLGWSLARVNFRTLRVKAPKFHRTKDTHHKTIIFLRSVSLLFALFLIPALESLLTLGFDHRAAVYQADGIQESKLVSMFVMVVLTPLVLVAMTVAVCASNSGRSYMKYAYALGVMLALYSLGRFPIYYMLYFFIVHKLSMSSRPALIKSINIKVLILILAVLISLVLFSNAKSTAEGSEMVIHDLIKIYFLNYHLIGFHYLDWVITSGDPMLLVFDFPSTSLGIVNWFLHLFTKATLLVPVIDNSFMNSQEIFNSGMFFQELGWTYNAFTTGLTPLYLDGGVVGTFLMMSLTGFLAGLPKSVDSFCINPYFLLVIFYMTFSLFQPLLSFYLVVSFVLMFGFIFYIRANWSGNRAPGCHK